LIAKKVVDATDHNPAIEIDVAHLHHPTVRCVVFALKSRRFGTKHTTSLPAFVISFVSVDWRAAFILFVPKQYL
jgi:hypothetical protein